MSVSLLPLFPRLLSPKFRVFAIGSGDNFPLIAFLEELKSKDSESYQTLYAVLEYTAEHGPLINDYRKSRCLDKNHKIYELKTKDGNRVTWFYDKGQMIVCTNGFPKPNKKRLKQDVDVAIKWRKRYEEAKLANALNIYF